MGNRSFFFDTPDFDTILSQLERCELDQSVPSLSTPLWGEMEGIHFLRITGQSAYWRSQDLKGYGNVMEDLVTGLYGEEEDFSFLIFSQANRVGVFLGAGSPQKSIDLRPLLSASFPGIQFDNKDDDHMGARLEQGGFLRYRGRLTGIPVRAIPSFTPDQRSLTGNHDQLGNITFANLERLIRGLQGSSWGLFLRATPHSQNAILQDLDTLLETIEQVQAQTRLQIQKVNQILYKKDEASQAGETESVSLERFNRRAEYVLSRLEKQLKRYLCFRSEGSWKVDIHFFSPEERVLKRMQSLLRSVNTSDENTTEPIRTFLCQPTKSDNHYLFTTLMSSSEIAHIAYLPREEFPGFQIRDHTVFDVDHKVDPNRVSIQLGTILENDRETALPYSIPIDDLSQHVLVTGMTGMGKTTTIFTLLDALGKIPGRSGVPFLVIEPTKSEYRSLLGHPIGTGRVPGLQVFTLGDENVSPFRLNPFQFEILDQDHFTHVQTHIDYLKSVFEAAFVLYPPMPYVLEICLHEIYIDRGWNLTTSRNDRLPEKHWSKSYEWPIFPTLLDLYHKIDEVTERLGYDDQIKMDIKAGLQTRISSMMIGGKGLMLNVAVDETIASLLNEPTVLELERIGNDEEKTFLMGLLLTRLFEYRRLQFAKSSNSLAFQHLTIIEEAHRLLRASPPQVGPDQADPRGHAVETFSNLLSEIRAYGEGILIAEQIPSKLTPDAIKNTNLKIIHRLVAADDRQSVCSATNMNESQSRYLVVIPRGEVAVFNQGDDHPLLLRIKPQPGLGLTARPSDEEICRKPAGRKMGEPDFLLGLTRAGGKESRVREISAQILSKTEFESAWCSGQVHLWSPNFNLQQNTTRLLEPVINLVQREVGDEGPLLNSVLASVIIDGSLIDYHRRGQVYGWDYNNIFTFRSMLLSGIAGILQGQIDAFETNIKALVSGVVEHNRRAHGPFPGCVACNNRCQYRYDISFLATDPALQKEWQAIIHSTVPAQEPYTELIMSTRHALSLYLGGEQYECDTGLQVCLSVQLVNCLGLSSITQVRTMDHICAVL